jgi:CheY-like chemotaxis protein
MSVSEEVMGRITPQRILVADTNPIFRGVLAERLDAQGHEVITAETGEKAFLILRDWKHPIDWLYARASLPLLIDGWILADEYHDAHRDRAVILSSDEDRVSSRGDLILKQPTPSRVYEAICRAIDPSGGVDCVAARPANTQQAA